MVAKIRKVKMQGLRLEAKSYCGSSDSRTCKVTLFNKSGSNLEANGNLDKYQLSELAKNCILALEAIYKAELASAEYTRRMIVNVRDATASKKEES